jgi:hypothetical protein
MAKISISPSNIQHPAPRWFRIMKRIIYALVTGGLLTGTFTRFGMNTEDQTLIMGWLMFVLETTSILLSNGETYAPRSNDTTTES